jgi:quercetin dioxygenase-like cupin family protein
MAIVHIAAADMPTDRSAIEPGGFTATVGRFHAEPGPPGAWHTHGEQHVVAFLISGKVVIESGPGGSIVTEPAPGDLVHIEPGTIHRETYAGDVAVVGFSIGPPPGRVDVAGPDPSS